ncbi:MAG: nicotinate-nucleotide adenylyltransferase [Deltaproteobacteria bacterium]|nr:nicotinate-nucleotide adenylyltransferase [Deltaproteobacteria bacterium]
MRLGLFGGTFDPIHFGHLGSAEEVRDAYALDKVCFVPCGVPPHRSTEPGAPPHHRLEMVRLAVADNPGLCASDVEVVRSGASFSIDTVRHFSGRLAPEDDLYLILGLDAFLLIGSWKDWRELLALTHVIVTSRPGAGDALPYERIPVVVRQAFCYDPVRSGFRNEFGKEIRFTRLTDLSVSASAIRELLGKRKSIRYLVPEEVQLYVEKHHLYSESPEC